MNQPYSAKCDVWSAGSLLYFLRKGKHPFMDVSVHHTILRIQKMTMGKTIEIEDEPNPTIVKILKMSLQY